MNSTAVVTLRIYYDHDKTRPSCNGFEISNSFQRLQDFYIAKSVHESISHDEFISGSLDGQTRNIPRYIQNGCGAMTAFISEECSHRFPLVRSLCLICRSCLIKYLRCIALFWHASIFGLFSHMPATFDLNSSSQGYQQNRPKSKFKMNILRNGFDYVEIHRSFRMLWNCLWHEELSF